MGVVKFGKDGVLKYGAAGSTAGTAVNTVRDVTIRTEPDKGNTSSRGSIMNTEQVCGLSVTIEFETLVKSTDASLTAMLAAANAGTPVALKTETHSGGPGWDGDFNLSVENGQPLRGEQTYRWTATPSDANDRYPSYSAGA